MRDFPEWVKDALRCPVTGVRLTEQGDEMVAEEGASPRLAYPIRDGIPVLLAHEAREVETREHDVEPGRSEPEPGENEVETEAREVDDSRPDRTSGDPKGR